jgi:hypothetical protein
MVAAASRDRGEVRPARPAVQHTPYCLLRGPKDPSQGSKTEGKQPRLRFLTERQGFRARAAARTGTGRAQVSGGER